MAESKTIKEKFTEAWAACENPELDGENPHFRNQYATLKSTLGAVRKACEGAGIAYVQALVRDGERFVLRSSVMDGMDDLALSEFPVLAGSDPQKFGSALTYAKRQQAQADFGITGEPDDDAEEASKKPARRQAPADGSFTARCLSCGKSYRFEGRDQYEAFIANPGCCPAPNWVID